MPNPQFHCLGAKTLAQLLLYEVKILLPIVSSTDLINNLISKIAFRERL